MSLAKPKVTVCVMTYNQEDYIEQCLRSIVEQETTFIFEIIVGDDCSTDRTREKILAIVKSYPNIVVPLFQKKNSGGKDNYLAIHRAARGEYVCHIDGDDWISQGKLAAQVKFLDENLGCPLVAHRMTLWNSEKVTGITRSNPTWIGLPYLLRHHPAFLNSSIMYRREEVGGVFSNDFFFIDFYVYVTAALRGDIGFIDSSYGNYRENIGMSSKGQLMPQIQAAIDLAASGIGESSDVRRCRSKQYLSYALLFLRKKNYSEFLAYLAASRKADSDWSLPWVISIFSLYPEFLRRALKIYRKADS